MQEHAHNGQKDHNKDRVGTRESSKERLRQTQCEGGGRRFTPGWALYLSSHLNCCLSPLQTATDDNDNTVAGAKNTNKAEQGLMGKSSMSLQVIKGNTISLNLAGPLMSIKHYNRRRSLTKLQSCNLKYLNLKLTWICISMNICLRLIGNTFLWAPSV